MRRKRDDVQGAARAVYGEVISKIRLHGDAHDQNIELLAEALEKIRSGDPPTCWLEASGATAAIQAAVDSVARGGRIFESFPNDYIFTREPLVIFPGLSEFQIDGEDVTEERFRAEMEVEINAHAMHEM